MGAHDPFSLWRIAMRSPWFAIVIILAGAAPAAAQADRPAAASADEVTADATAPAAATSPSMVAGFWHELKGIGSTPNLYTLALGAGLAVAVHPTEEMLAGPAVRSDELNELLEGGSYWGNGLTQFGGAIITYAVGRAFDKPVVRSIGGDLFQAQLLNS